MLWGRLVVNHDLNTFNGRKEVNNGWAPSTPLWSNIDISFGRVQLHADELDLLALMILQNLETALDAVELPDAESVQAER